MSTLPKPSDSSTELAPSKKSVDELLSNLFNVIYSITGAGATVGQLAELLEKTEIGKDVLCPELAIASLGNNIYSLGNQAYEIADQIRDLVEGGAS